LRDEINQKRKGSTFRADFPTPEFVFQLLLERMASLALAICAASLLAGSYLVANLA
jgi:hypothetical protein